MKSDDRVFILGPVEGKFSISSAGLVDAALYNGGNNLHAKQLPNGLWSLYLEHGTLPRELNQNFTSFSKANAFVREYYLKRNIEIKEIKD